MNRVDRLFAILLQLQQRPRIRAEEIAALFGISRRTVYRDMAALLEMGVPVVSLPGEGYEMAEGFFLPPLLFTPDEAEALFLGAQMLRQQAQGRLVDGAEQALVKLAQVLPIPTKRHVSQLTAVIQFYAEKGRINLDDRRLIQLITAIQERRAIWIRYFSYNRSSLTEREVEPATLTFANGAWYINGFCRLRQDFRAFRLDRVEALRPLPETFTPRDLPSSDPPLMLVDVCFDAAVVRWVRERQHYAFVEDTAVLPNGDVVMTYQVHEGQELVPWLLSWGETAVVLTPDKLRDQIAQKARRLLEKLT